MTLAFLGIIISVKSTLMTRIGFNQVLWVDVYSYFNPIVGVMGVLILHHSTISPNTHILIRILRPLAGVMWVPALTSYFILIFLIASANFPSLVLISLLSSSEPLSLPSSLTAPLNHVSLFFAQSISLSSSVIANFCPAAPGFCMGVFTAVRPPSRTLTAIRVHTCIQDYSQHAAEEINGSCVAWPQVGRALGGGRSIWEACSEGWGFWGRAITNKHRAGLQNWITAISTPKR